MKKGKSKVVSLYRGPYAGKKLRISDDANETMVFTVKGDRGKYVARGKNNFHWEEVA